MSKPEDKSAGSFNPKWGEKGEIMLRIKQNFGGLWGNTTWSELMELESQKERRVVDPGKEKYEDAVESLSIFAETNNLQTQEAPQTPRRVPVSTGDNCF